MLDADIATLWDHSVYNAGFVVVRPTWYGRRVYELMRQKTSASKKLDDQTALNYAIRYLKRHYKQKGFTSAILDAHRYVCGVDYFESSADRWPTPLWTSADNPLQSSCRNDAAICPIVVHNNWIVSREAKIYRFKEHLMWMYDKGRSRCEAISRRLWTILYIIFLAFRFLIMPSENQLLMLFASDQRTLLISVNDALQ